MSTIDNVTAKISKSQRWTIISRAKRMLDYFNYHNNNLNKSQWHAVITLEDGIDNEDLELIRDSVEFLYTHNVKLTKEQWYYVSDMYMDFFSSDGEFYERGDVSDVNSSRKSKASRTVYANSGVTKFYSQGDECTFKPNQEEYKLLEKLADKLMELSPNGFKYWVKDVYLDHGSKWMWTTVVAEDTVSPYFQSTYQALSPAEWLALMNGEDVTTIAESVLSDKYCPDRIRSSRNIRSGKPICSSTSYDNDALNRIEKLANTYQRTSMLRDDSEVEIDLIDDEYWICDYSESRGSSEPVRMACYADEVSRDEVIGLCKKNGWAYSM